MTTENEAILGSAVTSGSTEVRWSSTSRVALVRYTQGAILTELDGVFLVEALERWIGPGGEPFGVLADGTGLRGTEGGYRALVGRFFRQHRRDARIALINLGPVIHVVVEMFRLGTGVPLRSFGDEAAARAWLRGEGIAA
jgi:hypothetical protein